MRTFLAPLVLLLLAKLVLADVLSESLESLDRAKVTATFKGQKFNRQCTCTITFVVDGSKVVSSNGKCGKKCKIGRPIKKTLTKEDVGKFSFAIRASNGKAKLTSIKFYPVEKPTTAKPATETPVEITEATGATRPTPEGTRPTGPVATRTEPPRPTPPEGTRPPPPTRPLPGLGEHEACPDGFVWVCPEYEGQCKAGGVHVCPPRPGPIPATRMAKDRMMNMMKECQCMPIPVMVSVMEEPPVAGRSLQSEFYDYIEDRARVTAVFKKEKLNSKCICTLTFVVDGKKVISSKGTCGRGCNIKKPLRKVLSDKKAGKISFAIKVSRGKATISGAKATPIVKPTERPEPTEGPVGPTRAPSMCVCVYDMPEAPINMSTGGPIVTGGPVETGGPNATEGPGVTWGPGATGSTEPTTAAPEDEIITRVKGYIDAGTCGRVTSNSNCGDSATSYYKEFEYNGKRVIVSNQVPDHEHEHDMIGVNPNSACERYQYMQLPIDPAKGSTATRTGLGTIGLAVTGGAFFNDWSQPTGDLALPNEGRSLDSCFGHSAPSGAYHYHANINCTNAGAATGANDPDTCKLIGYYKDGVPVYGLCKDSGGKVMSSCYSCTGSCTSRVSTVAGTFTGLGAFESDYTYDQAEFDAGNCNLDNASGGVHPTTGKYSYFATTEYPWVPIYYYGSSGLSDICSAA